MAHGYPRFFFLLALLGWRLAGAQVADSAFRLSVQQFSFVASLATMPSGHVVMLGNHTYTNGRLTGSLVRFLPTGEFDEAFFQQTGAADCGTLTANNVYQPLVRPYSDGRLLLVNVTLPQAAGILRLLANGQVDPTFSLSAGSYLPTIRTALVQPDGKVLLAGTANTYARTPSLLRLNADGSLDQTFTSPLLISGTDYVQALAIQPDGRILVAGHFASPATGLVRLLPNGQYDSSFQPAIVPGGIVEEVLCRPDGRVLVGGRPTLTMQGRTGSLQQLLANGTLDPAFAPAAAAGYGLVRTGDNRRLHLLPGGRLCLLPALPATAPAAVFLLANGQPDPSRPPLTSWPLNTLTAATPDSAGRLVLAGHYRHRSGRPSNLVRLLASGQRDLAYAPQLYLAGEVTNLVEQPGLGVVLGGTFDLLNGYAAPNLARLLPGTSQVDTAFVRRAPKPDAVTLVALHKPANYLLVGGFAAVNDRPWGGLIRLYPDGRLDTLFRHWPSGYLSPSVAVQPDGRILVAGSLGTAMSSTGVARQLPTGDYDPSFVLAPSAAPGANARLLVQPDGRILLFGSTSAARVLADGRLDPTFRPTPLTSYPNLLIDAAVVQPDGRITLGGQMPPAAGYPRNSILRLLANGRRDSTLANIYTDPYLRPRTLLYYPDGRLLIGGGFFTSYPQAEIGLHQHLADGTPDPSFAPVTGTGSVGALLLTSDSHLLGGGNFYYLRTPSQFQLSLVRLTNSLPLTAALPVAATTAAYPNPAHGQLHLGLDAARHPQRVQLLDALGRVALACPTLTPSLTLDTTALPAGTYFLRIDYQGAKAEVRPITLE